MRRLEVRGRMLVFGYVEYAALAPHPSPLPSGERELRSPLSRAQVRLWLRGPKERNYAGSRMENV
jgi:hypothetical protein